MNSEQQQQRIIGYFIEEAREHLQTIEQGVLNLQNVLADSESINEVFRAAHSIKGGAAMLGVGSVQHVAHRLEDFFKIIKDTPNISVDERLTSLLLAGFDPLEELLDELQGNFKVSEESTNVAISRVKPIFDELEVYLDQLVTEVEGSEGLVQTSTDDLSALDDFDDLEDAFEEIDPVPSLESIFQEEITTKMRDMLQIFRSEDDVESRSQLQEICNYFQQIGDQFNLKNWSSLVTQVKNTIAQPSNSYRTLAPILIRELKESQDLVLANREAEIVVSAKIQSLLPYRFAEPEDDEISTIFTTASSNVFHEPAIDEWPPFAGTDSITQPIADEIDLDQDIDLFADTEDEQTADFAAIADGAGTELDWIDGDYEITDNSNIDGPKVGASELRSLAVLFENDDIDFEAAWEDIESNESQIQDQGLDNSYDDQDDFADLLADELSEPDSFDLSTDIASSTASSIDQLFGEFSADDVDLSEGNSLFPEDIDISLGQSNQGLESETFNSDGESYSENTLSELAEDVFGDQSVENDLSANIADDFADSISGNIPEDEFDFNLDRAEIDYGELAQDQFEQISDQIDLEQVSDVDADESEALTSEAFFATLAEKEREITFEDEWNQEISENEFGSEFDNEFGNEFGDELSNGDDNLEIPIDPFALTTSEENMALLDEPFMLDDGFDRVSLETPEPIEQSPISQDLNLEEDISDAAINIFDELGFDSDEFLEAQGVEGTPVEGFDSISALENFFDVSDGADEEVSFVNIEETNITDIGDGFGSVSSYGEFIDETEDFFASDRYDIEEAVSQADITTVEADSGLDFADLDITDAEATDDLFEQIDNSTDSDIDSLFANTREDNLASLDNDFEDSFDFDEVQSSIQPVQPNNDVLEEALEQSQDFSFGIDNDNSDITARTTLDNLADFFKGDDDADISILQISEKSTDVIESDLSFDMGSEIDDQFEGLESLDDLANFSEESSATQFEDINASSTYGDSGSQDVYPISQTDSSVLETEELNGIDDDFNFDDLEEMIGSQSIPDRSEFVASGHQSLDSQVMSSIGQDSSLTDADEMNFDDLEALLDEPSDLPTLPDHNQELEAEPVKPSDDFDELENMLQSAFAKDVGPIKTKTSNRPPASTRKSKLTDSTMRVDVKYLDSLNNLVGELVVNRNLLEQDQERLQQFITNLLHQVQLLSDVSQKMRDEYDKSLLEASLSVGRNRSFSTLDSSYANDGGSSVSSVSRDFEGIEFDRYNKFHILSQEIIELIVRVRESASDIEFVVGETDQVTRQLGTITTQIQDDLKQSRMVPFAQIADRLPRGIRDRALKTGKQADLEIFGRETLIDKAILESLTDPLTHLVNNAIDHGLEDPATRQGGGKVSTGHLSVRAYHQGNQTVISISDDGAGIDPQKVKKSAVSKRVRTQAEVDGLNDTEVYALLFEPGFSTAAQADEFKGRGVGLDVVKTCLDDIRGVIIVESEIGRGTTFTIRLPLTLSISKAMFCISDRARIAFPVDGFEDMVEVPQSQIILNEKGQPCLPWRDTLLPFQHLSNLLAYSRHLSRSSIYGKQENDELCIIILRNDTSYLALQVDQFLGEYEIVIKQLEGPIPQPAGIAGATVLGDGRVMAIANVLELFDIASGRLRPSTSSMVPQVKIEEDITVDPTVLIVDDSITVRELLSLTFAKVGYRVEQAKDGQDAWEKLRAGLPCDMIFCDIEMPRMDGLDLLSKLQKDARLKDIPVAMLTSRGADRHRQSAIQLGAKGYFTKPYLEEELLSASKRLLAGETLPI